MDDYLGYTEVWQAVQHLQQVLDHEEWRRPEFNRPQAVT
jgi:kynureninase